MILALTIIMEASIKTRESLWFIECGRMDTIQGRIRGGSHISSPWPLSVCTVAVVTTVEIDPGTAIFVLLL